MAKIITFHVDAKGFYIHSSKNKWRTAGGVWGGGLGGNCSQDNNVSPVASRRDFASWHYHLQQQQPQQQQQQLLLLLLPPPGSSASLEMCLVLVSWFWSPNQRFWLPNQRFWLPNQTFWLPNQHFWSPSHSYRIRPFGYRIRRRPIGIGKNFEQFGADVVWTWGLIAFALRIAMSSSRESMGPVWNSN